MSRDDRAALLGYFGAGFAELKKTYEVEQFQFHKAPAFSFLRVHQPAKFGDDLSSFRKTVVEANTQAQDGARPRRRPGGPRHSRRGADRACGQAGRLGRVRLSFGQQFFENFKKSRGVDTVFHLPTRRVLRPSAARWASRPSTPQREYKDAAGGQFLLRKGELGATPVAALLGPINDFSGKAIGAVEIVMDNSAYVSSVNDARLMAIAASQRSRS